MSKSIVTQFPRTVNDLEEAVCPSCEQPLVIDWRHWHGSPKQPCLICQTADCEGPTNYGPIPLDLWQAWIDHQAEVAKANLSWVLRLERQLIPKFPDLDSILNGSCPFCGQPYNVITAHLGGHGKVPWTVCSNPNGGQAHVRVQISDRLANEYQDFCRAMEENFGAWYEEREVSNG